MAGEMLTAKRKEPTETEQEKLIKMNNPANAAKAIRLATSK